MAGSEAGAKAAALRTRGNRVSQTIQDVKRSALEEPAGGVVHWRRWNGAESERIELAESRPESSRCVVAEFGGPGSQPREPEPENSVATLRRSIVVRQHDSNGGLLIGA